MNTVKGDKKLIKKLKTLPGKIEKKVCRKALRSGAKIQQKKGKDLIAFDTGASKKALKVRAMKRKTGRVGVSVIISAGSFSDGFYAAFPEYGTKYQEAQHNLKKAAEETDTQAGEVIRQQLKTGIETEAKK